MKLCDVGERTRSALSPESCRTNVFTGTVDNGASTSAEERATAVEASDSRKVSVKQLKVAHYLADLLRIHPTGASSEYRVAYRYPRCYTRA